MSDRYRVGGVTGWPITPATMYDPTRHSRSKPSTIFYVLDSAYCYRQVEEFRGVTALERATALAEQLNAAEDERHAELQRQLEEGIF